MKDNYLQSIRKQFEDHKLLAEKTMAQLPPEKITWQYNQESNSIAMIIKHLAGNMLSRWTDFLTTDGEKQWRDREAEFENDIHSMDVLKAKWEEGWKCLFYAIDQLTTADLQKEIFIRNSAHTVTEALNRQLAHYAYHVGQIVFIGKMICNEEWVSLSIPRGGSDAFNKEKFSQPKHKDVQ